MMASISSMTSKYASLLVYLTPVRRHGTLDNWPVGRVALTLQWETEIVWDFQSMKVWIKGVRSRCLYQFQVALDPSQRLTIWDSGTMIAERFYIEVHLFINTDDRQPITCPWWQVIECLFVSPQSDLHTTFVTAAPISTVTFQLQWNLSVTTTSIINLLPVIYSVMCFIEDQRYRFTLANNVCLLELIKVAIGHLDELQKVEKYPIQWSL